MKNLKFWVPILAALVLFSCSKPGGSAGNGAPVINWILADAIEYHPSYLLAYDVTLDYSISRMVTLDVDDPEGHDDIVDIRFTNTLGDVYILKSEGYFNYYKESTQRYETNAVSSTNLHRIELKGWTMTVTDSAGNVDTKSFDFVLPNLETPDVSETFLYSSRYDGSDKANGVSTLVTPTLTDDKNTKSSTAISIEYTPQDERTRVYQLFFFNTEDKAIAWIPEDKTTALSDNVGTTETYVVAKESILFSDGYDYADIKKFSWISLDDMEGTSAIVNGASNWWRHKTYGEVKVLTDI